MLWGAWLTANICLWMNDVAAAWMMTSLTASPMMVALVQSASTLPVFLLGLPSGALADILDRRRYFIVTQFWVAAIGVLLCLVTMSGAMSAPLLLVLTFANGIGLAMRWPVFAAIIPDLIPRQQLPSALALNGIAMNTSRIIGPVLAGALIATAGSAYVFALNAVLSIAAGFVIMRWKTEPKVSALPGERFLGAIRVGVQYVRQSSRLRGLLMRITIFFFQAVALTSLLPLVAKQLPGGDAGTFTLLLVSMGGGAVVAAINMPRLRQRMSGDRLLRNGTLLQAAAMLAGAYAPNVYVAAPAMVVAGMAVISVANSLVVSAQMALPNWVRARGMSIYQMSLMGGSAFGAALWGQVAALTSVTTSLVAAAVVGGLMMAVVRRYRPLDDAAEDMTLLQVWKPPVMAVPVAPDQGPVLTTIEYFIDPSRVEEFRQVMQESRSSRLRQGALSCEVFKDASVPGRYVEYMLDESWVEHLRRFDRVTAHDVALRNRRLALHVRDEPPVISRCISEPLNKPAEG
jgi:MFS family permease